MNKSFIFAIIVLAILVVILLLKQRNEKFTSEPYSLPVLVISLPDSPRREKMREMFKNYPGIFVFIDGVRLRTKEERIRYLNSIGLDVSENDPYIQKLGDMGCALAHINANNFIIQQNFPMALILEDDVTIDSPEVFRKILNYRHKESAGDYCFVQNIKEWGTGAQIVTNKGARVIVSNIDSVLRDSVDLSIIQGKVPGLKVGRGEVLFHQSPEVIDPNSERGKLNHPN